MTQSNDFSGTWRFCYWWPSNNKPGTEEPSEYVGKIQKRGDELIFESHPNEEKSYMFVRMTVDGDLVTGTWHEDTSPTGEFKGAQYSGAFQVLRNPENTIMNGKWAGIGGEAEGKRDIYTGRLQFHRTDKQE